MCTRNKGYSVARRRLAFEIICLLARAAKLAGLEEVPVIVHKSKFKGEDEALLIAENLKRRTVQTMEAVRAVERLEEIYNTAGVIAITASTLSKQTGYSEGFIKQLRTLADLVPSLAQLLQDQVITQKVAYQLAQLPEADQRAIAKQLTKSELAALPEDQVKEFKQRIEDLNHENKELRKVAESVHVSRRRDTIYPSRMWA